MSLGRGYAIILYILGHEVTKEGDLVVVSKDKDIIDFLSINTNSSIIKRIGESYIITIKESLGQELKEGDINNLQREHIIFWAKYKKKTSVKRGDNSFLLPIHKEIPLYIKKLLRQRVYLHLKKPLKQVIGKGILVTLK